MVRTKIQTQDRCCDAVDVTLKDLIVKDLLNESDKGIYYGKEMAQGLERFNLYLDKEEGNQEIKFNLSIDCDPASLTCNGYSMYLLSGENNVTGSDPIEVIGVELYDLPNTIVSFEIPVQTERDAFSYHKNGKSYANYVIYGNRYKKTRLMLGKGKIYVTDVLYDLTESILDGQ